MRELAGIDPRLLCRCVALVLLAAGFVVPPVTIMRPVYDVIAVLDITGSMNTRDQHPQILGGGAPISRLAMERRAVHRLLAQLPCGSRLGIAIFVEKQPFALFDPVETCANFPVLDAEIDRIDWRMGWDSESHIAATLLAAMGMAAAQNAELIFMTDGQETPPLWWNATPQFAPVRGSVRGLIIGVGGRVLVPIPRFDTNGREIGVFRPGDVPTERDGMFSGHEYLSAVDEPHLRALASSSGLAYRHLDDEAELFGLLAGLGAPRRHPGSVSLRWLFASGALMMLLVATVTRHPFHAPRQTASSARTSPSV